MSSKPQPAPSPKQVNQPSPDAELNSATSAAPAELKEQLQAMSQLLATQRQKPWYQASWVPITTASLLVSVFGLVMIQQLTKQVRDGTSLSVSEQLLLLIDSSQQSAQSPLVQAKWQMDFAESQPPSSPEQRGHQLALRGRKFFANHGAPSYFCLSKLEAQEWQLQRCEVQQLGTELISVRYFRMDEAMESNGGAQTRVFTVKRDALCKQSLARLQAFDQQRENVQLFENPCSVSILLMD